MAIARSERDNHIRGKTGRIVRRKYLEQSVEEDANYDIRAHMMGEPSEAFYPASFPEVINIDERRETRRQLREQKERHIHSVQNRLFELAAKQKIEDATTPKISGNTVLEIFDSYISTQRFKEQAGQARRYESTDPTDRDLWLKFGGRVFEDIAFGLLPKQPGEDELVFSPKSTYRLMKALYPNGKVVKLFFDQNYISGKDKAYVPDSLLVNTAKRSIEMVIEYTLNPQKEQLELQYQRFQKMKKRFPNLVSDKALFVVIIPMHSGDTVISQREDVRVLNTPFTKEDFTKKFNRIWENSLPSAEPSLSA